MKISSELEGNLGRLRECFGSYAKLQRVSLSTIYFILQLTRCPVGCQRPYL